MSKKLWVILASVLLLALLVGAFALTTGAAETPDATAQKTFSKTDGSTAGVFSNSAKKPKIGGVAGSEYLTELASVDYPTDAVNTNGKAIRFGVRQAFIDAYGGQTLNGELDSFIENTVYSQSKGNRDLIASDGFAYYTIDFDIAADKDNGVPEGGISFNLQGRIYGTGSDTPANVGNFIIGEDGSFGTKKLKSDGSFSHATFIIKLGRTKKDDTYPTFKTNTLVYYYLDGEYAGQLANATDNVDFFKGVRFATRGTKYTKTGAIYFDNFVVKGYDEMQAVSGNAKAIKSLIAAPTQTLSAAGYNTVYGTGTTTGTIDVASVDGVGYKTLTSAIAAATGKTVVLERDITLASFVAVKNQTTLDLNGHTITTTDSALRLVGDAADLTVVGAGGFNVGGYAVESMPDETACKLTFGDGENRITVTDTVNCGKFRLYGASAIFNGVDILLTKTSSGAVCAFGGGVHVEMNDVVIRTENQNAANTSKYVEFLTAGGKVDFTADGCHFENVTTAKDNVHSDVYSKNDTGGYVYNTTSKAYEAYSAGKDYSTGYTLNDKSAVQRYSKGDEYSGKTEAVHLPATVAEGSTFLFKNGYFGIKWRGFVSNAASPGLANLVPKFENSEVILGVINGGRSFTRDVSLICTDCCFDTTNMTGVGACVASFGTVTFDGVIRAHNLLNNTAAFAAASGAKALVSPSGMKIYLVDDLNDDYPFYYLTDAKKAELEGKGMTFTPVADGIRSFENFEVTNLPSQGGKMTTGSTYLMDGIHRGTNATQTDWATAITPRAAHDNRYARFYTVNDNVTTGATKDSYVEMYFNDYLNGKKKGNDETSLKPFDNYSYFSYDFDFTTDSVWINGLSFLLISRKSGTNASAPNAVSLSADATTGDVYAQFNGGTKTAFTKTDAKYDWHHLTVVGTMKGKGDGTADVANCKLMAYLDGQPLSTSYTSYCSDGTTYISAYRISFNTNSSTFAKDAAICFDNVLACTYANGGTYTDLAALMADPTKTLDAANYRNYTAASYGPVDVVQNFSVDGTLYPTFSAAYAAAKAASIDEIEILDNAVADVKIDSHIEIVTNGFVFVPTTGSLGALTEDGRMVFDESYTAIKVEFYSNPFKPYGETTYHYDVEITPGQPIMASELDPQYIDKYVTKETVNGKDEYTLHTLIEWIDAESGDPLPETMAVGLTGLKAVPAYEETRIYPLAVTAKSFRNYSDQTNYTTVSLYGGEHGTNNGYKDDKGTLQWYLNNNTHSYKLISDIVVDAAFTFNTGVSASVDLNGYSILVSVKTPAFNIPSNGTLTISSSRAGGAIVDYDVSNGTGGAIVSASEGAKLVVNGENVTFCGACLFDTNGNNATIDLNGGTYMRNVIDYGGYIIARTKNALDITIDDATFVGVTGSDFFHWQDNTSTAPGSIYAKNTKFCGGGNVFGAASGYLDATFEDCEIYAKLTSGSTPISGSNVKIKLVGTNVLADGYDGSKIQLASGSSYAKMNKKTSSVNCYTVSAAGGLPLLTPATREYSATTVAAPDSLISTLSWTKANGAAAKTAEKWLTTDKASAQDPANTAGVSGKYSYVWSTGDAKTELAVSALTAKSNLTLYSDFNYNLYLLASDLDAGYVGTVSVGGSEIECGDLVGIGGEDYYKFAFAGIDAKNATDSFVFHIVGKTAENVDLVTDKTVSIVTYAERVLELEALKDSHQLMIDMLNYINEAKEYFEGEASDAIAAVLDGKSVTAAPATFTGVELGNIADAFTGAYFNLGERPEFRFLLKEGYTGTVTLVCGGSRATFEVENGKADGNGYLTLPVGAHDLYKTVSITIDGASAAYSLANYINAMAGDDVLGLAKAMYVYSTTAETYKNSTLGQEVKKG